ncbi:MAG TPA: BamA/TamA family outer membrane protein [Vicinamibacterales bacterium]|jgi:outer membrane protein assembly complex protein YaeT|nr:BamA/TamA family outer membrane protein [Vicinamibacterales bacterium]
MSRRSVFLIAAIVLTAACHEEGGIKVADLTFEGVKAVQPSQLKNALATAESDWLPWGTKRYFNRAQFDADLKRITAFYADRGYPDARVVSTDVDLNKEQNEVKLRIRIDEGQPIVVEEVRLTGFEKIPEDHLKQLRKQIPLKPGRSRDLALVQVSRERALDELRDHGHPYAHVQVTEGSGTQPRQVVITYAAEPGPAAVYGPIEIVGNTSVGDNVIRRMLTYKPGELFRLGQLQESQRRLYGLQLFEFVNVDSVESGQQLAEVPTRATITEGKHRKLTFGFGYGTEEKVRGTIDWRHVNFYGGARTAGVEAKWSSLDRGVRLNFVQPYFFSPNLSFSASGQGWFSNEPSYTLDTLGGRATVSYQFAGAGPRSSRPALTTMSGSFIHERESYTIPPETLLDLTFRDDLIALGLDPRTLRGKGVLAGVAFDFQRNTTGNILDARRGYLAALHVEKVGHWLSGDFNYYQVNVEARHYLTIGDRFVIANRARLGSLDGPNPIDDLKCQQDNLFRECIPFFKRYFLGGSTSLRGWGRFEVGPLSGSGLPLGGFSMMELTSELRVPLWRSLGGVVFVEAGNAFERSWQINFDDLRADAGVGLRYLTPIGPIRFDFGYQLTRIDGLLIEGVPEKYPFRFHFSIGQAF